MSSDNDTTLNSYNDHVQEYVDLSPKKVVDGEFKAWIDQALSDIAAGAPILELGSGFGRDADYIESLGHQVSRTDAAQGFVDLLKSQGHEAYLLNALTDEFGKDLDMIFANAVLHHFGPDQFQQVLRKAYKSLKTSGILAFSVKEGKGASWSTHVLNAPRYFYYWNEDQLRSSVESAGFTILKLTKRASPRNKWLQVIVSK